MLFCNRADFDFFSEKRLGVEGFSLSLSAFYVLLLFLSCFRDLLCTEQFLFSGYKITHKQTLRCFTNEIDFILAIIIPLFHSKHDSYVCLSLSLFAYNHCFCHTQIDTRKSREKEN